MKQVFSNREQQVYDQLVAGVRPSAIAKTLKLSPKTVDTYRAAIMRKLGLDGCGIGMLVARHYEEKSVRDVSTIRRLKEIVDLIERFPAPSRPGPCGPESGCGAICMERAMVVERLRDLRVGIK